MITNMVDKTEAMELVTSNEYDLSSPELLDFCGDKDVVLAAVKNNLDSFKYASEELKNDKQFLLSVVKEYGMAIRFVREDLRNDAELMLAAIESNKYAIGYASDELKKNSKFALSAVKLSPGFLKNFNPEIKKDNDVVSAALKQKILLENPQTPEDMERIKNDIEQYGVAKETIDEVFSNIKKIYTLRYVNDEIVLEDLIGESVTLNYKKDEGNEVFFKSKNGESFLQKVDQTPKGTKDMSGIKSILECVLGDRALMIDIMFEDHIAKQLLSDKFINIQTLLNEGRSPEDMREILQELDLKEIGASVDELKQCNYNIHELKTARFTVKDLKNHYTLKELRKVGFDWKELRSEFTNIDLKGEFDNSLNFKSGKINWHALSSRRQFNEKFMQDQIDQEIEKEAATTIQSSFRRMRDKVKVSAISGVEESVVGSIDVDEMEGDDDWVIVPHQ